MLDNTEGAIKKMDNPEKLATQDTQDEEKNNPQHNMFWTLLCISKQDMLPSTNKTCSLPQTAGGKDEQNIVSMRKLQWTSQDGTQNITTHKTKTNE